jgi:hypothetical protein
MPTIAKRTLKNPDLFIRGQGREGTGGSPSGKLSLLTGIWGSETFAMITSITPNNRDEERLLRGNGR